MSTNGEVRTTTPRRGFIKALFFLVSGLFGLIAATPVIGFIVGPLLKKREMRWVEAGSADQFSGDEPQARRVRYVSNEGYRETQKAQTIWVTATNGEFIVFSSKCTHLSCTVSWRGDEGHFFCPCHGGKFDSSGEVIDGPPPRPLDRLATKIEDGILMVQV